MNRGATGKVSLWWGWAAGWIVMGLLGGSVSGATAAELVEQVSVDSYANYVKNDLYAHDGNDRCFGPAHDLARDRIKGLFEGFGLETSLHPFQYQGATYHNVVGVHRGVSCPNEIYVLGAHYDTIAGSPGAWDNASGVAGVLEAARLLSQQAFEGTLVFIAFDREEQNLGGSTAYVNDHLLDHIHGMICLDGIAWRAYGPEDPNYNTLSLFHACREPLLLDDLAAAVETYTEMTCVVGPLNFNYSSDHAPFDDAGFAAVFLASYLPPEKLTGGPINSFQHTAKDSVDQGVLDYAHGAQVTRAVVGCLAAKAIPASARAFPDFDADGDVDGDDHALLLAQRDGNDTRFDIAPPPQGDGVVDDQDVTALLYYSVTDRSQWWTQSEFETEPVELLAHWKLDETEGLIAHDSAGANDGNLIGAPVWQPLGGAVGGALQFDGVDDVVKADFAFDPTSGPFSVFAWIKGGVPGQIILSQADAKNWLMTDNLTGNLMTGLHQLTLGIGYLTSPTRVTDGRWHRVGLVWDGVKTRILYVDGVEVARHKMSFCLRHDTRVNKWLPPGSAVHLGAPNRLNFPGRWSGLIDDVRLYKGVVKP